MTETVAGRCSGARIGFAPHDGATLDESRTNRGGTGRPRGTYSRSVIERIVVSINGRLVVLSGRVSGHGHKDDLETRLERLQACAKTECKGQETLVLCTSGSGLKAGRRHLQRSIKLVCEDTVAEGVIPSEDWLTRFGQAFLATLFACFDVTLTVLEPGEEKTPEQEPTDDLLALIASSAGRLYGRRSHK